MNASISYRMIPFNELKTEEYFELYRKVYKDSSPILRRWKWEYVEHPFIHKIKFIIAEDGNRLVAATARLPFEIKLRGQNIWAYFSVDSFVDPDYRRMGIMQGLYGKAAETMPLLYSKGTMPKMYDLLMKFGYQPVIPNTFLICYVDPVRLLKDRLGLPSSEETITKNVRISDGFIRMDSFGEEFDIFGESVIHNFASIVIKNSRYMNWRYIQIPHKRYHVFYHKRKDGGIASVVVMSIINGIGKIVDIIWDPNSDAEPGRTISFCKSFLKKSGCKKILCWCTYGPLRASLKRHFFLDRGETPRFSVYSNTMQMMSLTDGSINHFVDGDGDFDFL